MWEECGERQCGPAWLTGPPSEEDTRRAGFASGPSLWRSRDVASWGCLAGGCVPEPELLGLSWLEMHVMAGARSEGVGRPGPGPLGEHRFHG